MFGELISLVDLLRSGAIDAAARKSVAQRKSIVGAMLEAYFLLKDLVDEGALLVEQAGADPKATIRALPEQEAKLILEAWDFGLKRQSCRMRRLSQLIFGQDFLEVVSPDLRDRLDRAIGSKFHRASSLAGIGAALFFRAIFPIEKEPIDRAQNIAIMAGEQGDLLDTDKVLSEIHALRAGLEAYRLAIVQLASSDELISLTAEAKRRTDLSRPRDEA